MPQKRLPLTVLPFFAALTLSATANAEKQYNLSDDTTGVRLADEAVQWTEETVTVVDEDALSAMYRMDIEALEGIAPSLIIDRNFRTPRGANIAIRGIYSNDAEKGIEPAIASYVDGVYQANHTGTLRSLFDVEKVEIMRGPAALQLPAPNLGGAVMYTRSRPTGELGLDLELTAASLERREVGAVLNLPSLAGLNTKLAVNWADGGGEYMRNLIVPREENESDYLAVTVAFLYEVSDDVTIEYSYDTEDEDGPTPALLNLADITELVCSSSLADANCRSSISVNTPQLITLNNTAQNFSNLSTFETDAHRLSIDFNFMGQDWKSITALRDSEEQFDQDLDATDADFYSITSAQTFEQFSQEFQVTGSFTDRLSYAAGFYWLETEYDVAQEEFFILPVLASAGLASGFGPGEVRVLSSDQEMSLQSAFYTMDYAWGEQWNVDVGARYYYIEKDFRSSPLGVRLNAGTAPSPVVLEATSEWDEYLVTAGISYKVDEEAMIYARFNQGFRPGGFDENAVSPESGQAFDAEESSNIEVGMKSEWYDDTLRLNLAFFQTQYKNKREQYIDDFLTGAVETVVDNVARNDSRGWEVEFEYVPMTNLYFRGGFSHLKGEVKDYDIPDLANGGERVNLTDIVAEYAPDNTVFISGRYSMDFYGGVLSAYAGYRLNSGYWTDSLVANSEVFNFSTWDLAVDYEWRDVTLRAFSHNVNDKRYLQEATILTEGNLGPHIATATAGTGLVQYSGYNQPKISGFSVIYKPDFSNLFGN